MDLEFRTDRQRELMRVVLSKFNDYSKRHGPTNFYTLQGMSASHITCKAVGDSATLKAFWPAKDQSFDHRYGNLYSLKDDTLEKVQNAIRDCLDQLSNKGYLEKTGNEHERRYRLPKSLTGVTL